MKVRFTPQASADLRDIADYLRRDNPNAALRVRNAILEGTSLLASFPDAGHRQGQADIRKLVTLRYRYLIYYTADRSKNEIAILSIRHPARERDQEDL